MNAHNPVTVCQCRPYRPCAACNAIQFDDCATCGETRADWHRCEHCGAVPIERLHDLVRRDLNSAVVL